MKLKKIKYLLFLLPLLIFSSCSSESSKYTPIIESGNYSIETSDFECSVLAPDEENYNSNLDFYIPITISNGDNITINSITFDISNPNVISSDALKYVRSQIDEEKIYVERSMINVGKTSIKVKIDGNGNNDGTLFFNLTVMEYGSIEVDSQSITLMINLEGLFEESTTFDVVLKDNDYIYGSKMQEEYEVLNQTGEEFINNYSLALNHKYSVVIKSGEAEYKIEDKKHIYYEIADSILTLTNYTDTVLLIEVNAY